MGAAVGLGVGCFCSLQPVKAKQLWSTGQSSLFDEGQRTLHRVLASSQFVPQKYVASGSVGDQAFCVGPGEGRGVAGSGGGVFVMGYGEGRDVRGCCVGRGVVAPSC